MVRCKFKVSPGPSRTPAHRFYCTNIDVLNGWLPEVPETHKAELEESIQKSRSLADAMFGTHSGRDDGGRSYLDVLPVVFCMNGFGMFRYEVIPQYISLRFSRLRTLGVSFPKDTEILAATRLYMGNMGESWVLRCADTEEGRSEIPVPGSFFRTGNNWAWRPLFRRWRDFNAVSIRGSYALYAGKLKITEDGRFSGYRPEYLFGRLREYYDYSGVW